MNRHDYDVVLQHSYDMGVEAGVEKGREEGTADAARKMIESGMLKEQVAAVLQLSTNELEALLIS